MIKEALLGLLADQPMHGYDLKLALDRLLGRTTPMNVGQVYTALNKLEKDGLIGAELVSRSDRQELKVYHLTSTGAAALHQWYAQPVEKVDLRDELFIKLSLARRTAKGDVAAIVRAQRSANLRAIQELTRLKGQPREHGDDIELLIEGAILHLEADIQWLDLWEHRSGRG